MFCATREAVRHLHAALRERGFDAVALSGEMSQRERTDALQALRDRRARVCVATDVAARGLDLPDLGLVIHADLPSNRQALLHRSGRTGRAGKKGISLVLAPFSRRRRVEQLLAAAGVEATWSGPPSAEAIRAQDQARLLADSDADRAGRRGGRGVGAAVAGPGRSHRHRRGADPHPSRETPGAGGGLRSRRTARRRQAGARRPHALTSRATGPSAASVRRAISAAAATWCGSGSPSGRSANADPKWLIPLICRRGHVTKKDIGSIRIFDRETKFEIARDAVDRFAAAMNSGPPQPIRIEAAGAPGAPRAREEGDAPRAPRPKSFKKKPSNAGR